jgi:hypothetical protein
VSNFLNEVSGFLNEASDFLKQILVSRTQISG